MLNPAKGYWHSLLSSERRNAAPHDPIGFTMVELVVAIVILAILAATALPRFFDFTKDARVAALQSLAGSIGTADAMMYTYATAKGMTDGSWYGYIYPFEDKTAKVYVVCGHPNQTPQGILAALSGATALNRRNVAGVASYDYGQFAFSMSVNGAVWSIPSAKDPANCSVTYQFDQMSCSGDAVPIAIETSGC